ncbi:hypothetical protein [Boudabousia marimammalium]|uniref:Uncharacterized protein n=1 Tax=Boudabousia marimammalium TaxID=156892 RepID=A0A1Q5PM08_9ACTO|nr:hypothetical protein [Boudabousia marimammalium]OKL48091.1 hypothetical protein BM477_06430 [Boudabousia marimammalium]
MRGQVKTGARRLVAEEDGRISLLMLALGLIVFMVLAVGVNLTAIKLEYSQLQAEADNLAAALATATNDDAYYPQSGAGSPSASIQQAETSLKSLVNEADGGVTNRRVAQARVEADTVFVELSASLRVPLLTELLGTRVETVVFSSARRE